jgi:hypothetical protein
MEIIFSHPCDRTLRIKRKVPKMGTTKKLIPFVNGEFEWHFTSYEYHFVFEYKNNGEHKMFVCSGNPNNCFDWSSFDSEIIVTE